MAQTTPRVVVGSAGAVLVVGSPADRVWVTPGKKSLVNYADQERGFPYLSFDFGSKGPEQKLG